MNNSNLMESQNIENMSDFFNSRVDNYDDLHHQKNISWGIEIRDIISRYINSDGLKILDLGAGTGIELEQLFKKFPNSDVTCIDISDKMLEKLQNKFQDKKIKIICDDFLKCDLGQNYDVVISVMALHHFTKKEKIKLYKKIYNCLKPNGYFINSDYIIDDKSVEENLLNEYKKIKQKYKKPIHFDIPMTLQSESEILYKSGFKTIKLLYENKKTKVLLINK